MTKTEDFRKFLADMDELNVRLDALAKEASAASMVRATLLRQGKAIGLTIAAVDQMLANIRVDYRPPVDADADADADAQDGGAPLAPTAPLALCRAIVAARILGMEAPNV